MNPVTAGPGVADCEVSFAAAGMTTTLRFQISRVSNRFQYATFGVRRQACLRYTVSASTEVVLPISERRVHRTLGSADHLRSAVRVEEPESRKLVLEGASGVPPKSPQFPGKLTFGASKPCVCNARRP
jgi:hypothetical protein